jgi:putative DNA primase/helicase
MRATKQNPAAGGCGAWDTDFVHGGRTTARSISQALGGSIRNGNGFLCHCPVPSHGKGRGDRKPSLSVSDGDDGAPLVHCFAGCDSLDVLTELRRRGLTGSPRAPFANHRRTTAAPGQDDETASRRNREFALQIWQQAKNPRSTLAEAYLRSRALELPSEAANEALRFHPACPFGAERFPAMVCLVRNIRTDEPQALQRTALLRDGKAINRDGKTFRLTLGPIAGGAVKLDPDEDVTQGLCIGEGVETCLAGRQMGLRPVWALLGTSGLASFLVLPGVDGLYLFREHDAANERAAMACGDRWHMAGRDVFHVYPERGNDLADELRGNAA